MDVASLRNTPREPKSSIVAVMPQCMECTELKNIYLNQSLKYRIALTESGRRLAAYDLNKLRDAKLAAGQILQDHELTHNGLKTGNTDHVSAL